jgi:hypothetical protein
MIAPVTTSDEYAIELEDILLNSVLDWHQIDTVVPV